MINGAHMIIYSQDADADRAFLRDVLGYPHVDVGGGWLIFKLPPAELAVHPAETESAAELYLMCDDLEKTMAELADQGVAFASEVSEQRWGVLTSIRLPGGGTVGLYEPKHEKAIDLN